jgi:hypothetical protein
MAYTATHIATVPSSGFAWYLIFVEASLSDPVHKEIDAHFNKLGSTAGRGTLVVRGHDPASFRESVYALHPDWGRVRPPALIVTDEPPAESIAFDPYDRHRPMRHTRAFVFSLEQIYQEEQTLAKFLIKLIETLNEPEAIEALEYEQARWLRKERWGWLNRWLMLEPNISGFGVRGNEVLKDVADL